MRRYAAYPEQAPATGLKVTRQPEALLSLPGKAVAVVEPEALPLVAVVVEAVDRPVEVLEGRMGLELMVEVVEEAVVDTIEAVEVGRKLVFGQNRPSAVVAVVVVVLADIGAVVGLPIVDIAVVEVEVVAGNALAAVVAVERRVQARTDWAEEVCIAEVDCTAVWVKLEEQPMPDGLVLAVALESPAVVGQDKPQLRSRKVVPGRKLVPVRVGGGVHLHLHRDDVHHRLSLGCDFRVPIDPLLPRLHRHLLDAGHRRGKPNDAANLRLHLLHPLRHQLRRRHRRKPIVSQPAPVVE